MSNSVIQTIDAMEERLRDGGKTVAEFCRFASIARSTWDRWKTGRTTPNMKTWSETCSRLEAFLQDEAA